MRKKSRIAMLAAMVVLAIMMCPALAFADLQGGSFESERSGESGAPMATQSASVSNPRVIADSAMGSGQKSTWDCVWFGSYPQTEVAASDPVYFSLQSASWNASGDATVGGAKYKRISKQDATDSKDWPSLSGNYRYFRYEPVKWRVLSVSGGTAFVVADIALDGQRFNANRASVSWATSSIRSWLNGYGASSNQPGIDFTSKSFVDAAFSSGEQSAIVSAKAVGNDKVLLLAHSEVSGDAATAFGFSRDMRPDYSKANASWVFEDRMCKGSDFAIAMGASRDKDNYVYWWIRLSQNASQPYADVVGNDGRVYGNVGTALVSSYTYGVRPAMNLDLSSSYISYAGTVSSDGSVSETPLGSESGGGSAHGGNSGGSSRSDLASTVGAASKAGFTDLDAGAWYMSEGFKDESGEVAATYLDYAVGRGLMSGYAGTTRFGPDDALSRGMAATIIYRMATGATAGTTDNAVDAGFPDVERGAWYAAAVKWCAEKGVVTGYKDGTGRFGPGDDVTREQLAAMVARYCTQVAGMPPAGSDVTGFPDGGSISDWAREAAAFCNAHGIITGFSDSGNFGPWGKATRCQMAKIIAVTARLVE